jgi:shikimate dehydrogenase
VTPDILDSLPSAPFCVILGHPVSQSLSPRLHSEAFRLIGLDWRYVAIDLPADWLDVLPDLMAMDKFMGANVTIPHKKAVMPFLDAIEPGAAAIGAVNTIARRGGDWIGHNTDLDGFLDPIVARLPGLEGRSAVVFGSGGASAAVRYALRQAGMRVITVSRRPDPQDASMWSYEQFQTRPSDPLLWVNATPLGMGEHADRSPLDGLDLRPDPSRIGYDLIYGKSATPFLRRIGQAGGSVITGDAMFVGQARRAFELWTGVAFPEEAVRVLV